VKPIAYSIFKGIILIVLIMGCGGGGGGDSKDTGTVSNSILIANPDTFTIDEDPVAALIGNVLNDNGSGADELGDAPITVSLIADVTNGALQLNTDGTFSYLPGADFNGVDNFSYAAVDSDSETSNTAIVTITVIAKNDGVPIAVPDTFTIDEDPVAALIGNVLNDNGSGADELGDAPITVSLIADVTNGALQLNTDGTFSYLPGADFNGVDNFSYAAVDSDSETSNTAIVTITVIAKNDGVPIAVPDTFTIDEDPVAALIGNVLNDNGSGADELGDAPITVSLIADVTNGALQLNTDGTFSYLPGADFNGVDNFSYAAVDSDSETSNTAIVTITVIAKNDGVPIAVPDTFTIDEDPVAALIGNVLDDNGSGADELGDAPITVSLIADVTNGALQLNTDGTFSYLPGADFNGVDNFSYAAVDSDSETSNTAIVTITVIAINDGVPIAVPDSFAIDEDPVAALTGNVLDDNGSGADELGDAPITVNLVADVTSGTLLLNTDGTFSYLPDSDFSGTDNFSYTTVDSDSETSDAALVTITVNAIDDGVPIAVDDPEAASTRDGVTTITVNCLSNDSLFDHAKVDTYSANSSNGGTVSYNGDGTFTYIPPAAYIGEDSFTYTLIDDQGETSSATVSVMVKALPIVIIDNRDAQTSQIGTWIVSGGPAPYNTDSVYSRDGNTFTWHFSPTDSGFYAVSMWWTVLATRSSDVPVDINHADGLSSVYINQQKNGGKWNVLEVLYFESDTTYDITITAQGSPSSTCADAVRFQRVESEPYVAIVEPLSYHIQTSPDLTAKAIAVNLDPTWKIKFVLDIGTPEELAVFDTSEPYEALFTDVVESEHTIHAIIVDSSDQRVVGVYTQDQVIQVGIGNYYVAIGDSITFGEGDDDPFDDISQDGRNSGGGYEPILNDRLTDMTGGVPHTIVNQGIGGQTSAYGLSTISFFLEAHPESQRFLVQWGTNDARPDLPVPSGLGLSPADDGYPGSFKDNMQQIIDAINAAGKEVCIAKPPITLGNGPNTTPYTDPDAGVRSVLIKEYNEVIDELKNDLSNNIVVTPPDFYSLFNEDVINEDATEGKRYDFEYTDNLHPNGDGYRSMADRWLESLNP
jgi:lysophospholipase L1-like esterase/predicted regulator of Ras-like GTPase activity (Roadblock/LC7/MglB family)